MSNTETNRIENKEQLNEDFEQEIIAFLNYKEGGIIYVGVRKDGQVVGLKDVDLTQLQIKDRIKNNIQPSTLGLFDVIVETIDNKEVLHILDSTYQSSSLITGLSIKNDGEFKNLNRIIKEEDLNNLENLIDSKIDEFLSDVFNCNFNITSKIDDKTSTKKDLSCKYCEYKAICYKTSSDTIYLNSKKGDDNNGLD